MTRMRWRLFGILQGQLGLLSSSTRLLTLGDIATQGIAEVPTQSQNKVSSELTGESMNIDIIELVLGLNEEKHSWILGNVVSIECGAKGWYYASCRNCFKKVEDRKHLYKCLNCGQLGSKPPLKYRLNVVLLWNSILILGKTVRDVKDANPELDAATYLKMFDDILEESYLLKLAVEKNISNVDTIYSVIRVSDGPSFIELYSSRRSTISGSKFKLIPTNAVNGNGGSIEVLQKIWWKQ